MRTWARLPIALGAGGAAITLVSAVPTLGDRGGDVTTYGSTSPGAAVLELVTGAALFAAATVLATDRRRAGAALATFFLAIAWSAGAWAGWDGAPTLARPAALLVLPMIAPAALLVTATLLTRSRVRNVGILLAGTAFASAIVLWLVRDPFLDRYCWRDCLADALAPLADVDRARTATHVTLALSVVCGLATVILCVVGLRSHAPGRHALAWALTPGVAVGAVLGASSAALLFEPAENPSSSPFDSLFVARCVALTAFAAGLIAAIALRRRVVREEIARLARDPFAASLARAFDDPDLRVAYPLADGTVVDSEGQPVALGTSATRILRGGELVALIDSSGGTLPTATLHRELGPAGRLALANERLRAEELARVRELTELRRRIVATGDAARRRLERDLHDGAQQRLLALTYDLRVAIARAESAGRVGAVAKLRDALERVNDASTELREIAHGIFPAVLTTSGLVPAAQTLADTRRLMLILHVDEDRRYPPEIEAAAYAVLSEGTARAVATVRIEIGERDGELLVTVDDAPWDGGVVSVEDRVGALGGAVERVGSRVVATLPVAS